MPPTLDARILRFSKEACREMSAEQAASILGISRHSAARLCEAGTLPAVNLLEARNKPLHEAVRRWQAENPGVPLPPRLAADEAHYQATKRRSARWTITDAALMHYILRSTTGDHQLVLAAIQEHCPAWHGRALEWATALKSGEKREERREPQAAPSTGSMPSTRSRRRAPNILSFQEEYDLFPQIKPAAQVAA